ncbi:GNAT family N-acetyltransferase [Ruminococcaceae bacterium OttesenSCG-928-O06]|nr:GNAT family N-acetyltransferase [Ruminococcaceae bacterium OttesenSCG-928-O06]
MGKEILETHRLLLREMDQEDFRPLAAMLQDAKVMTAYEHTFSHSEVGIWLGAQMMRYVRDGFGLWAVVLKKTGEMVGQCGITWQQWEERTVPEIGYLLRYNHCHNGYATEAAMACREYAFDELDFGEVFSIIRENNYASQKVARRMGMEERGEFVKHYYGIDMPHIVFSVRSATMVKQ